VTDATGLDGTWDLTLTFSMFGGMPVGVPGAATGAVGGGPGAFGGAPSASDPSGIVTIFQAIEKLGLKLERQKRPMPVIVIDRLERTPTEN
jgi:uncharacterized protein (TIGR03435 family)